MANYRCDSGLIYVRIAVVKEAFINGGKMKKTLFVFVLSIALSAQINGSIILESMENETEEPVFAGIIEGTAQTALGTAIPGKTTKVSRAIPNKEAVSFYNLSKNTLTLSAYPINDNLFITLTEGFNILSSDKVSTNKTYKIKVIFRGDDLKKSTYEFVK